MLKWHPDLRRDSVNVETDKSTNFQTTRFVLLDKAARSVMGGYKSWKHPRRLQHQDMCDNFSGRQHRTFDFFISNASLCGSPFCERIWIQLLQVLHTAGSAENPSWRAHSDPTTETIDPGYPFWGQQLWWKPCCWVFGVVFHIQLRHMKHVPLFVLCPPSLYLSTWAEEIILICRDANDLRTLLNTNREEASFKNSVNFLSIDFILHHSEFLSKSLLATIEHFQSLQLS